MLWTQEASLTPACQKTNKMNSGLPSEVLFTSRKCMTEGIKPSSISTWDGSGTSTPLQAVPTQCPLMLTKTETSPVCLVPKSALTLWAAQCTRERYTILRLHVRTARAGSFVTHFQATLFHKACLAPFLGSFSR